MYIEIKRREKIAITEIEDKNMKVGNKVKTYYGKIETVMTVEESRVITYESARRGNWYHPTKVLAV